MPVIGGGGGGGGGLKQQARWSTVSDDLMAGGCCANLNSSILPNYDVVGCWKADSYLNKITMRSAW